MIIELRRIAFTESMGTFGELLVGPARFFTVEKPWADNRPYESCIPPGEYQADMLPTTTPVPPSYNDQTWYLHGGSVGVDVGHRTRIAIHIANVADDVQGCIGVGKRLSCIRGKWGVASSTDALEQLRELLPDEFSITISHSDSLQGYQV